MRLTVHHNITVDQFLPHIAVAFGFATTFSDIEAQSFSLSMLSGPKFFSFDMLTGLSFGIDLSVPYSTELNLLLWDKLAATFTSPTFNGVAIPNLPQGMTFAAHIPRGEFDSKCILVKG